MFYITPNQDEENPMAQRVIAQGDCWMVERIGTEEFVEFPGTFAEFVIKAIEESTR